MATEQSLWSTVAALRAASARSWERGEILRELLEPSGVYPRRRALKSPTAGELRQHFAQVRTWAGELHSGARHFRLETRSIGHQSIGANEVPQAIWFDAVQDEIGFLGKAKDAARFLALAEELQFLEPGLRAWVLLKPFALLALDQEALVVARVSRWLVEHPDPGIYVRQLALDGVHTKFVEKHVRSIDEMAAVLVNTVAPRSSGMKSFRERHGFTREPEMVRVRAMSSILKAPGGATDLQLPAEAFETMAPGVRTVLVTENKTNFLALPLLPETLVVFGAGYGFAGLRSAEWVSRCELVYWGDLDTHGFAILNQLRTHHRHVRSVLMDRRTLLEHRGFWGVEGTPMKGTLAALSDEETELYAELVAGSHGKNIRLEQEQINWEYALEELARICRWEATGRSRP
ncbi:Wadjet anti-phage system protein JetD domain-containing protein [Paeniglutamicibacter antarcticus]|uniref:DUF3322 and DUF2220 domain-containing protein n=1 Tax=Paeniglutamicibacter antarcticus TaxID=494023 RepID=A0ABP9TNK7_9MICC